LSILIKKKLVKGNGNMWKDQKFTFVGTKFYWYRLSTIKYTTF